MSLTDRAPFPRDAAAVVTDHEGEGDRVDSPMQRSRVRLTAWPFFTLERAIRQREGDRDSDRKRHEQVVPSALHDNDRRGTTTKGSLVLKFRPRGIEARNEPKDLS